MANPEYLTLDDLKMKIGEARVVALFDDDNDGNVSDASEIAAYNQVMNEAEGIAASYLLRAYTDEATIITLAGADETFKGMVAWVACELASERRVFSQAGDGRGEYWAQYERAIDYFDRLSKGRRRSKGEADAGTLGNLGGVVQPSMQNGAPRFIFATEKGDDGTARGHGGF